VFDSAARDVVKFFYGTGDVLPDADEFTEAEGEEASLVFHGTLNGTPMTITLLDFTGLTREVDVLKAEISYETQAGGTDVITATFTETGPITSRFAATFNYTSGADGAPSTVLTVESVNVGRLTGAGRFFPFVARVIDPAGAITPEKDKYTIKVFDETFGIEEFQYSNRRWYCRREEDGKVVIYIITLPYPKETLVNVRPEQWVFSKDELGRLVGELRYLDKYSIDISEYTQVLMLELTAYRPENPQQREFRQEFTVVEVPNNVKGSPGVGIRMNGPNKDTNLVKVNIRTDLRCLIGEKILIARSNDNIKVWRKTDTGGKVAILDANNEQVLDLRKNTIEVWVEWVEMNPVDLEADPTLLEILLRPNTGSDVRADTIRFYPFKSIIVAYGGENQTFNDVPLPGMFVLATDLYEAGYDVHAYDEDVGTKPGVYDEVVEAIQLRGVKQIAIYGFSHGGGNTHDLAKKLDDNRGAIGTFTIVYTGYVDAIAQPLGRGEQRRPPASQYHVNYYQTYYALWPFIGHGVPSQPPADFTVNVNDMDWGKDLRHTTIDDAPQVLDGLYSTLMGRVTP